MAKIFDKIIGALLKLYIALVFFIGCLAAIIRGLFKYGNPEVAHWGARLIQRLMFPVLGLKLSISYDPDAAAALGAGKPTARFPHPVPVIIMPNHQNEIDVVVCGVATTDITIALAKSELRKVPIFAQLWSLAGNMWIDRNNRKKAIEQIKTATQTIGNRNFTVFPEGTRNKDMNSILPFKKGPFYLAIDSQYPIVLMVISPYRHLYDPSYGLLRNGTIHIRFCTPIPTAGKTRDDIPSLLTTVRDAMIAEYKSLDNMVAKETKSATVYRHIERLPSNSKSNFNAKLSSSQS